MLRSNIIGGFLVILIFCLKNGSYLGAQPTLFEYKQHVSQGDTLPYRQLSPSMNFQNSV